MSVLPDVLARHLDIVFCGTAAGEASARRKAYYAGPGNAFWPTLHKVGLTPHLFEPEEYRNLKILGLGLTDLVKTTSGSDRSLSKVHFDTIRLRRRIQTYRPRILAFTSKRAARTYFGKNVEYGLLFETEGGIRFLVLPSPSGAARKYWSEKPWHELSTLRNRR